MSLTFSVSLATGLSTPPNESPANDSYIVAAAICVWTFRYAQCGTFTVGGQDEPSSLVVPGDTASDVFARVEAALADQADPSAVVLVLHDDSELDGVAFHVERVGEQLLCRVEPGAWEPPHDVRLGLSEQLQCLALALRDRPRTEVEVLPLVSPRRQRELAERWRGPTIEARTDSVLEAIAAHCEARPEAIAVHSATATLTYAQLDATANQIAHWLIAHGVQPGAHVAVSMDSTIEFLPAMLGVWKARAVHVPVEPTYPAARIAAIVEETQPTAIIVHRDRAAALSEHGVDSMLVLGGETDMLVESPTHAPDVDPIDLGSVAYVIYTSGTTGRPKGVMISHASLRHYIDVAQREYAYDANDSIIAMARFSFSITFFELLSPLCCGGRLRIVTRDEVLDLHHMVDVLTTLTCIHASPSWWRRMTAHIDASRIDIATFDNLRHVSSGGDMVPPDVLEAMKRIFRRAEVFVIYGCSEIACMGVTYPVPRDRVIEQTRVGRAFPNMSVRLVDRAGQVVPPGFVGEVYFGGDGLATGYLHAPELTQAKFLTVAGERLYRTGDVGIIDAAGDLRLLGRSDFQIKLRGFRIEPAEIEVHLRKMDEVDDVVVSAPEVAPGDKRLVAHVVLAKDAASRERTALAVAMRSFLRERVPQYMVPAHFAVLDALPLNHNGKVDRKALPPFELPTATGGAGPRTEPERQMLKVWRSVMKQPGLGIFDDFFEHGGDSLLGSELMTQIHRQLGAMLPVSDLVEHSTVESLAPLTARIKRATPENRSVVCLRPGTARPALFLVHDGEGETIIYRHLAKHIAPGCPIYGIHPKRSGYHPILHTRISEMVEYYADQIVQTCDGPYVLGGLCIGGFLSLEVARVLRARGHAVVLVALLDAPHVTAPMKGATLRRFGSLGRSLGALGPRGWARKTVHGASIVVGKMYSTALYEATSRLDQRQTNLRIRALRYCIDNNLAIPTALRHVGVDATLRFAEKEFELPEPYDGEVVLFRATQADSAHDHTWVDDRPYSEFVDAPALGWEGKSTRFAIEDTEAGHSSMLQAAHVTKLAGQLQRHLDRLASVAAEASARPVVPLEPDDVARVPSAAEQALTRFVDGASLVVVIVSYRSALLVVDSLEALLDERALHDELRVAVVDNNEGGDAETIRAAIAERGWEDWATVIVAPHNGGYAYGNNLVVRASCAADDPPDHFWLLNPDTQVRPGSGRALLDFFAREPAAGIAGSCLVDPDGTVWGRGFRFPSLLGEFEGAMHLWPVSRMLSRYVVARRMGDHPEEVDWLSGASLMIRREVFEAIGLFDDGYFLYYEETDFCLAARHAGWTIWYVPDSRVMHIAGQSTGVTARGGPPRRIPDYVYDSRRRYFVKNHGWGYAALTDVAKISALAGYRVRCAIQRKEGVDPPHLLWDSIRGSVFVRGARHIRRQRNE